MTLRWNRPRGQSSSFVVSYRLEPLDSPTTILCPSFKILHDKAADTFSCPVNFTEPEDCNKTIIVVLEIWLTNGKLLQPTTRLKVDCDREYVVTEEEEEEVEEDDNGDQDDEGGEIFD